MEERTRRGLVSVGWSMKSEDERCSGVEYTVETMRKRVHGVKY